jgi:predicted nucleic acid-binding protein
MSHRLDQIALVDTSFWYAAFTERDQNFVDAQAKLEQLLNLKYVLPWPVLYETVNSKFVQDPLRVRKFDSFLKRPNAELLDDKKYKLQALERALSFAAGHKRRCSLVDIVLHLVIEDASVRIRYLFSYDHRDFHDICKKHRVELV